MPVTTSDVYYTYILVTEHAQCEKRGKIVFILLI